MALNNFAQEYVNRLKDAIASTSALGRVSSWLEKHTTLHGKPFSFKDHEFQKDIVDDTHPNSVVTKPSQVGVSECICRLGLGFIAISPDTVAIYTLPTVYESLRFSKSRIDPVIRGSRTLSELMVPGGDSASFKQIGSSQLFMMGTFGKAIISIPTDILISDEIDFSNPEVLVTAESRLSHSRIYNEELDIRGIRRQFSTPTLPNMGVAAKFDKSDQRRRLVRCNHCNSWFWPNFLEHVVVAGFDGSMYEITYLEVQSLESRGLLETAKLLCPSCRHPIKKADLGPENREWVAEYPERKDIRGWAVSPFDLPKYHNPTSLLRKMLQYKEEIGHFRNFTLGLPFADASNSVMPGRVKECATLMPINPESGGIRGTVMALDVGKTSWLMVGRNNGSDLDVIWYEQIKLVQDLDDALFETVVNRIIQFGVELAVFDAQPYTDTMLRIQRRFSAGQVLLAMYTLTDRRTAISQVRESDYTLEINRTKALDAVVKRVNNRHVKFARLPDLDLLEAHLQNSKRVDRTEENGDVVSEWVKAGPDHYMHCLNYLNLAATRMQASYSEMWTPRLSIMTATVGKNVPEESPADPLTLFRKDYKYDSTGRRI